MLKDLKILNGDMTLKFDSLNTIYTINMSNDDNKLEYEYKIDDGYSLSVYGNKLDDGLNEVVFTVYNDKEQMSYYLYVYKEKTTDIVEINDNSLPLNVVNKLPEYVAPTIGVVCFLFILLFFTFLFKKNKKC